MSDDTMPGAPASGPTESSTAGSSRAGGSRAGSSREGAATADEQGPDRTAGTGSSGPGSGASGTPGPDAASSDGPPKRRRRRGSRGGRNRRKPNATGTTAGASATGATVSIPSSRARPAGEIDDAALGHDYTSPHADRGLTTDDVAEKALEEAGLVHTPRPHVGDSRPAARTAPSAARPKIGDSRPAEPEVGLSAAPAAKRRRRRGGRGRGRGTGAAAGDTAGSTTAPSRPRNDVVRADLGVGDEPLFAADDDVLERRRGRTRKGRPAGRYLMCVHVVEGGHTHIAILEGRSLVEHSLATPMGTESIDGNIYLGRVQNVLPGMEAAFVDIGTPKNGVLYRGDVAFDKADLESGGKPKIERLLKNGQMIVVQVTKNPIAHKGARLTQEVSLAGRFLVMVPGEPDTYGISKRLPDDERKRLRRILDGIRPADAGLIVRTAAEGATQEELERDVRRLRNQWEQISALAAKSKSAKLLYQEPDLVLRLIREEFTKEYRGIVIDDRALYEETRAYVEAIAPELAERVEYYDRAEEGLSIFERFNISEQLLKALDRKVWLPSGGSLVIERTEALTVIDVNTGKNVGKTNLEETVYRNNLEAAEEIARQLRLRDIGGIIVIDFIDMEIHRNRDDVMRVFRDSLARDKTRTQAFEMSELGLVEMTRKRISEGLVEAFSETCPNCHGRGFVLDEALLRSMD
jgi:ribonuclease E